ncbi:hypothetical protein J4Q44_G00046610 [Coregonus suidteri]|uniref:Uncharacterized protein n=1 Tax=Coregonus suidteri TaxID=861788 RepID=A0AAN8M984_9TELE
MFKTLYALGVTSSINVARAAAERLQSGRIMEESGEDEDEDSSCGSEESLSASEESHSSSPTHSLAWTNPTPQLHKEVLVSFPFSFPIPLQVWFPQALFPFPPPAFSTPLQKLPQALLPLSLPFPPLAFLAPFPQTVCVGATAIPPTATGTSATGVWRAEWNQTEEGNEQHRPHPGTSSDQPKPNGSKTYDVLHLTNASRAYHKMCKDRGYCRGQTAQSCSCSWVVPRVFP